MRMFDNAGAISFLAVAILALQPVGLARSQSALQPSSPITTQERIELEAWWPTKSTLPLTSFAGPDACSKCHDQGATSHRSSMRRASVRASDSDYPRNRTAWDLRFLGINYSVASGPGGVLYSVAKGQHSLSRMLDWVMGAGDLGKTFLYQADGRWYQSNVSLYTWPSALDVTTGLHIDAAASLPATLGTPLSAEDARSCFGCHTVHATTSAGFSPAHAEPGIGCEACHGPAGEHVDQTRSATEHAGPASVFNPARLSPSDSIDFCGACHRSSADAALSIGPGAGTAVVRFQPYRLEESKCWRSTKDARLTCVACHDPHLPLDRDTVSYDMRCLTCHTAAAKDVAAGHSGMVCPKATSACVSCHMPKVAVASMHGEFTDHYIRIVRAGEALPN